MIGIITPICVEGSHNSKSIICIYTNLNRNEFAIGIKEDDLHIEDENEFDWKQELKNWIIAAKKDESIFLEVNFADWSESGERIN